MEITTESLEQEINELKAQLTGDMFKDMDLKDKIHNLTMKLKGVRPMDSSVECVGCGS
jgi:ribosomal protein L29